MCLCPLEMQSDRSDSSGPTTQRVNSLPSAAADTRGKHRIQAELKRLEQETRFLEVSCFFFLVGSKFGSFV